MKERPILFSGSMVRAILAGRKTVTRRVIKPAPLMVTAGSVVTWEGAPAELLRLLEQNRRNCPYGQPGDRLWVRESCAQVFEVDIPAGRPVGPVGTAGSPSKPDWKSRYVYRADGDMPNVQWHHVGDSQPVRWTPSIHMPRLASRILLEITDVRVERLQHISEEQARAEGVVICADDLDPDGNGYSPCELFSILWVSINGHDSWHANPWVWVVEFKRVEQGE